MYHTCRYCKNYNGHACVARIFHPTLSKEVYRVAEDGGLSAVIEETLNEDEPTELLEALDGLLKSYKISKVRTEAIKKLVCDMMPQHYDFTLKEKLDENISRLYQERIDNDFESAEVLIADPENFSCSEWR